ncbi:unnamed protein product [Spodoptera exigua]|nr:unnamed protein product [Spodoptera exigua]
MMIYLLVVLYIIYLRLSAPTSGSIRRRARERRRAEQTRAEGERIAREKRERRAREKLEQQRKAREELATYQPWGRAGGGAPNPRGVRFTNLRDKGIFPEDELRNISKMYLLSTPWKDHGANQGLVAQYGGTPETLD